MNFKKFHESKNLFDGTLIGGIFQDANFTVSGSTTVYKSIKIYLTAGNYTLSWVKNVNIVRLIIDGTYTENVETDVMTYAFMINNSGYFGITFRDSTSSSTVWDNSPIMLNKGSTALPYEPYGDTWHDIPYYQHKTATDTLTLPATLYPNDTSITVGIKGQSSQSGTPSPSNPVPVNGCGERTENLFDKDATDTNNGYMDSKYIGYDGNIGNSANHNISEYIAIPVGAEHLTISNVSQNTNVYCQFYDNSKNAISIFRYDTIPYTVSIPSNAKYIRCSISKVQMSNFMLNTGSTPLPYEPYGYKIPISSANTTTPVYLGEVESTRRIKKLVLTGDEAWNRNSGNSVLYLSISDAAGGNAITSMCTEYPAIVNVAAYANMTDKSICIKSDGSAIWIRDTDISSVTDFKTHLAQQYTNGTPVCVWYVLATETTGIVNEPIRKIGDYADTVSGITIPTIAGENTLSIGTTLQPSEVTVNYKGWHPVSSVHERDNGAWT